MIVQWIYLKYKRKIGVGRMYEFENRDTVEFQKLKFLKRFMRKHNGFIAGGCFKNIFNNEPIKGVDMWFRNELDYEHALQVYNKNSDFKFVYKNKNVTAYKDKATGITIELIKKTFLEPKDVIKDFDFTITKFVFYSEITKDSEGEVIKEFKIMHHKDFFEHLFLKKLVIESDNEKYPFSTFERSLRYTKYGYNLCRESKKRLIKAIREQDQFDENDLSKSFYDGFD